MNLSGSDLHHHHALGGGVYLTHWIHSSHPCIK
jgi:hypothetical protein